jgi:hypothetical protein
MTTVKKKDKKRGPPKPNGKLGNESGCGGGIFGEREGGERV